MDIATQAQPLFISRLDRILQRFPIILQLMRFGAIGVINTALDFIILNFLSKWLGINAGSELGALNVISFSLAVVQSYFWNRYWTFSSVKVSLVSNFRRLLLVGGVGVVSMLAVLIAARYSSGPSTYAVIFAGFIIAELCLWIGFKLHESSLDHQNGQVAKQFIIFVIVSLIGLLINSVLVSVLTSRLDLSAWVNPDLAKNLAKIGATVASLIWNFIGYKLLVFKK